MKYEWDEAKRVTNVRKHGLDFVDVPKLFEGTTISFLDERKDYGEDRYITLGLLEGLVIVVAHTENEEVIRIISARKATRSEERAFYRQVSH